MNRVKSKFKIGKCSALIGIYVFVSGFLLFTLLNTKLTFAQSKGEDAPFAVVELFTSEGCSSCPAADKLLINLTTKAREESKRIYTLSFHVDYWNYIGWVDPFSSSKFSNRQRNYARFLESSSVYTPQMIINGQQGFVGSSESSAKKFISQALEKRSFCHVSLNLKDNQEEEIEVAYEVSNVVKESTLNIALVERNISSQVTRGENAGKILKHDNVVRNLKTIDLKYQSGTIKIVIPTSINLENSSIVGYVQLKKNMHIIGANAIDLNHVSL